MYFFFVTINLLRKGDVIKLSENFKKRTKSLLLTALVLGPLAAQSFQGLSAEASEAESLNIEVDEPYVYSGINLESDIIQPNTPPSQGGGGNYTREFHQHGSSSSAQQASNHILGFLVGWGLSWIPGVNAYAAFFGTGLIAGLLTTRPVVYYTVSTYIQETSTRGRQVRTVVTAYDNFLRETVIGTDSRLVYEY